jgi:RsiW-degrading membrane proteinase PrsW (M82 family)
MAGDWGSLRVGSVDVALRAVIAVVGVAAWLAVAIVLTGFDNTIAALAANAVFVVGLFVLATLTRTLSALLIVRAFLLGASAMAIMLLLGQPLGALSSDPASSVDPIAEELLKLTPLALLLWQGRRMSSWQLGATDVLLICAAAGAGFAVVEDAYIRMNEGWGDTLPFLPTTEIYSDRIRGDRLISGHAIWAALSGITIGIALLMIRIRPALILAPLGFVIATADHIAVNSQTMPFLAPVVIALFLAGTVAAIALDLYVQRRGLPPVPELDQAMPAISSPAARWPRIVEGRRLRYAAWRLDRRPAAEMGSVERAVRRSVERLLQPS